MRIRATGIVTGERTIEFDSPLSFEVGAIDSVDIDGAPEPPKRVPDPRRLLPLAGIGHSGLSDMAENKHRYLAEAYSDWMREDPKGEDPA